MKKALTTALSTLFFFSAALTTQAATNKFHYTDEEYVEAMNHSLYDDFSSRVDRGVVIGNYPMLGYLTYKNQYEDVINAPYYTSNLVVEKQNIDEIEERIGYIDELFPLFEFDPRDTTIDQIKPGDNIYIRTDANGYITYISAYSDYFLRYGQVNTIKFVKQNEAEITFKDEAGQIFKYNVPLSIFVTKLGRPIHITNIKPGEWAKFLVSRIHLEPGVFEEEAMEIVVDPDSRIVEDIYKGEILKLGSFDNSMQLADARLLEQTGFGQYIDIATFNANPRNFNAFLDGQQTSFNYVQKYVAGSDMTAYVAIENYWGEDNVAKVSINNGFTKLLDPAMIVDTSARQIRLMGGEILKISGDSIIIKGDRLVDPTNLLVGDTIQCVVDEDNNLRIAKTVERIGQGSLNVYRGTIKRIDDYDSFIVETFSLLKFDEWYYNAQPRTFAIDNDTKFYEDETGFNADGLNEFLDYGPTTEMDEIFTIIADGEKAIAVSKIPYTREVAKGMVYDSTEENVFLKDVFYYNVDENLWRQFDQKNLGVDFLVDPATLIIKDGQLIDPLKLEKGDKISVMLTEPLLDLVEEEGGGGGDDDEEPPQVNSYLMLVQ